MNLDGVEALKHAKKNEANIQPTSPNKLGQYITDLLYGEGTLFS